MINRNMPLPINSRIYLVETHNLKVSGYFDGSKHIARKREKNCLR